MPLNRLSIDEMIELTENMVTPGHPLRGALLRVPGISPLMPHIEGAHKELVATQASDHMQSLDELEHALETTDARHDRLASAVYYTLEASINLSLVNDDIANLEVLQELKQLLFPNKLRVVSFSYRDEAGQAKLLSMRIQSEHEQAMVEIPMLKGTLHGAVHAWLAAGKELGRLEEERDAVNLPGHRLHASRARSKWIRAVRAIRTIIELTEIHDSQIDDAMGHIIAAEMAAERRARKAAKNVNPGTEHGEPAADDDDSLS